MFEDLNLKAQPFGQSRFGQFMIVEKHYSFIQADLAHGLIRPQGEKPYRIF